jgi:Na+/proline symporter
MGAVLILRWYWWRINAWSEISAMLAPLIIYPVAKYGFSMESPLTLYPIVIGTTIIWLVVTYLTQPIPNEKLINFYKKTTPGGFGWKRISTLTPEVKADSGFGRLFVNWLCGVVLVYSFLFGIGNIIFTDYLWGSISIGVGIVASLVINFNMNKEKYK